MRTRLPYDPNRDSWEKLHQQRDPWCILAIGGEATACLIHVHSNSHLAAEMVMSTYHICHELNSDIARLWLLSLPATSFWPELLTQSFFLSWLADTAPKLLPAKPAPPVDTQGERETDPSNTVDVLDNFSARAQAIPVEARTSDDFRDACAAVLDDVRRWESDESRLERNVGGFNALQALNMSRWGARQNPSDAGAVHNAAAFGLEFLPGNDERYEGSFLKKVLDGEIELRSVTLGTRPKQG